MNALPLHAKLVHLPLALAVVMPLVSALLLWALQARWLPRRSWVGLVLLQLLLVGGAVAALKTGEPEWSSVEKLVPEAALETHEEAAERFLWGGAIVLALMVAAPAAELLAKRERVANGLAIVAALGTVAVLGLAVQAGEAGGRLVYQYGAADAYKSPRSTSSEH